MMGVSSTQMTVLRSTIRYCDSVKIVDVVVEADELACRARFLNEEMIVRTAG